MRRVGLSAVCLAFPMIVLLVGTALADGPPPANLQLADGHWTAWNPPQSFPEGAQTYIIQRGDTLWDLAQRFLGDSYLWPQLWESNQYILDAHWIYPGDPLLITATGGNLAAPDGVAGDPLEEATITDLDATGTHQDDDALDEPFIGGSKGTAPVPLGSESDIYCSGYIGSEDEQFPHQIMGSEYEFLNPTLDPQRNSEIKGLWGKTDAQKYALMVGDIVYLGSGRADGLSAGETLSAVATEGEVRHPLTGDYLGRFYQNLGRIRVLSVQESSAIAEIMLSCHPITVGTVLKVFEPEPVPLRRLTPMRPVNFPVNNDVLDAEGANIVHSENNLVTLGAGHLVYIDRGIADDAAPGDVFTIYRRGRRGFPPIVVGELAVLSVQENASLARILRSRYAVFVGDALVLK